MCIFTLSAVGCVGLAGVPTALGEQGDHSLDQAYRGKDNAIIIIIIIIVVIIIIIIPMAELLTQTPACAAL